LTDKEQNNSNTGLGINHNPLITVISVNYNSSISDVTSTIQSVLNQNYSNLEYIIVDGASTNGSLEYIQSLNIKNLILHSQKDSGIYEAMNKGINLAKGDWILMMNMGDTFVDDKFLLSRIVESGKLSNAGIVYGNTLMVKGDLKYIKKYQPILKDNIVFGVLKLNHQSMFTHHSIFKKLGLFDEKRFKIGADFYWLNKVLHHLGSDAFIYIDEIIAIFKEEGLSSNQINFKKMHEENRILLTDFSNKYWLLMNELLYLISKIKTVVYSKLINHPKVYVFYRKIKYFKSTKVVNLD
jgi:glycosyltransferase involved in cell wall biosynthesis